MTTPTLFISYSHKDEDWKDRLVAHLGVLESQGMLDLWDDRRIEAGDDWYAGIEAAMDRACVAVLLVSANFLTSKFILNVEVPRMLQRSNEESFRVFPVIAKPCVWKQVPWLVKMQLRPKYGRPLSGGNEHQIDTDLAAIAEEVAAIILRGRAAPASREFVPLGPDKLSLAKLPSTSPDLFGRENELAALDAAWENPAINVISLVAFGGVGKTALVSKWLSQLGRDNYRGAARVFGWSFYNQGAAEGRQVSADPFIAAALEWFDDSDPTKGSPWDKGERLAELIKQERTLLILDGLEPLQNPPPVETGRIKDPALCSLLRELARQNPGLVVISTRLTVDDLKDYAGSSAVELDLENLSPKAGAAHLKHLGVNGADNDLETASVEFGGHALALTLLGTYLTTVYHGDVNQRDKRPHLFNVHGQGPHAGRVMAEYEQSFDGRAELDILRLMGLFDRPAEASALDALRQKPAIEGLTERLQGLSHANWQFAVTSLRTARLLAEPGPNAPDTLDCHPLLREYFGEEVRTGNPKAWREAHSRLYEFYKSSAKEFPDTVEEMVPLYAAVIHGCQAGRHQESLDEVYSRRIQRGDEFFNGLKLGAIGADLSTLSGFFDDPWHNPIKSLTEAGKAYVLIEAGFALRAFGRLAEATQPTFAGLQILIALKNWRDAAIAASGLSQLYVAIGDLPQALDYARQGVDQIDCCGDAFHRVSKRTALADVLHQAGRLDEAAAAFSEAEDMQRERQPESPLLHALLGFRYCDLLLSLGKYVEVQCRARQTLVWTTQHGGLLDKALDLLSLGRAEVARAQSEGTRSYSEAVIHLDAAVDGLRKAEQQQHLPRGLLARAELYRVTGALDRARRDVDEAFSIATRGGMRLHEADCHLEYARLFLACGEKENARDSLAKAQALIEQTGYHRRDEDLRSIQEAL